MELATGVEPALLPYEGSGSPPIQHQHEWYPHSVLTRGFPVESRASYPLDDGGKESPGVGCSLSLPRPPVLLGPA